MDLITLVPMPPTRDQVARDRIRQWLSLSNTTQTAFGARLDKTQAWVSKYLSGEIDADLQTLEKIADMFGHKLHALLDVPVVDAEEAEALRLLRTAPGDKRAAILKFLQTFLVAPTRRPKSRHR